MKHQIKIPLIRNLAVFFLTGLAILFLARPVSADLIRLKNGNEFKGETHESPDGKVSVVVPGIGTITLNQGEIESIQRDELPREVTTEATSEPASKTSASVEENLATDSGFVQAKGAESGAISEAVTKALTETPPPSGAPIAIPFSSAESTVTPSRSTSATPPAVSRFQNQPVLPPSTGQTQSVGQMLNALNGIQVGQGSVLPFLYFSLVILVVGFVFYTFCAFCFYKIAKKTNTKPAWFAWVPILQGVLMCWVARISAWWLLIIPVGQVIVAFAAAMLHLAFIAVLNPVASLIFAIVLGVRMVESCNKPKWLGILFLVPPVNLILLAYLAFSKGMPKENEPLPMGTFRRVSNLASAPEMPPKAKDTE